MAEFSQLFIAFFIFVVVERRLKPSTLRKWLSLTLLLGGLIGRFTLEGSYWLGVDLHLIALFAILGGVELFFRRNRFDEDA
ncbi:hypothetical protein ACIOVF_03340 [Pseudomonas sp. NPDC087612]|uniref:hypothetical protein n=1 Tax=unclassified Pseudomonas TaxID=196821 RepID=UPI0005EB4683|nr:hypothetical protein [Pseudomonas sp. 2(2015)]KJK19179.1 hypothetical protein UB48_05345 [Pseudomonas sp. 2(2015)]